MNWNKRYATGEVLGDLSSKAVEDGHVDTGKKDWSQWIDASKDKDRRPDNDALTTNERASLLEMGSDLNRTWHKFTSSRNIPRPGPDGTFDQWADHLMPGGYRSHNNPYAHTVSSDNQELAEQQQKKYRGLLDKPGKTLGDYTPWVNHGAVHRVLKRIMSSQTNDSVYNTQHSDENFGPTKNKALNYINNRSTRKKVHTLNR